MLDDVPEPIPGEDEVLFEIRCAGVNPIDVWATDGTVAGGSQTLPFAPGVEATGEADGRRVLVHGFGLGVRRDGLYRERAAVPRAALLPIPDEVSFEQAAGLFVPGATAWTLVHHVAAVQPDDRVLVLGASGGVGTLVIQLALAAGATVWGQTSNDAKAGFLEEVGAAHAVVAGAAELPDRVAELKPTVVIDSLGDGFTGAAVAALQPVRPDRPVRRLGRSGRGVVRPAPAVPEVDPASNVQRHHRTRGATSARPCPSAWVRWLAATPACSSTRSCRSRTPPKPTAASAPARSRGKLLLRP